MKILPFDESFFEEFNNKTHIIDTLKEYLKNYPENSCKSILVEEEYIDKNYLIDYVNYYARCFLSPKRIVQRIHFFSLDDETLKNIFMSSNEYDKSNDTLQKNYLGFTILKDLNNRIVGKTVLKVYPTDNSNNRYFGVTFKNEINLFGFQLLIDSVPFQEQDRATAACASISIWSSMEILEHKFKVNFAKAASEITEIANECRVSSGTVYPSNGLNVYQILYFFRTMGYEGLYIKNKSDDFYREMIMSYLDFGLPIIALLNLQEGKNKADRHTALITGYRIDEDGKIIEFYVHDDQIGPFIKTEFINNEITKWSNEWKTKHNNDISLTEVIIPIYPKIRVPFEEIYFKKQEEENEGDQECDFTILLSDVNTYKQDIRKGLLKVEEESILLNNMSKYFWIIRTSYGDQIVKDIIFDATKNDIKNPINVKYNFNKN
jgi:hypothetical protein